MSLSLFQMFGSGMVVSGQTVTSNLTNLNPDDAAGQASWSSSSGVSSVSVTYSSG